MSKADELKSKNENLFERNTILLNENERLKKEKAELEAKNEANENGAKKYAEFYFKTNDQLAQAKELLKKMLATPRTIYRKDEDGEPTPFFNPCYEELKNQAEQFLKE